MLLDVENARLSRRRFSSQAEWNIPRRLHFQAESCGGLIIRVWLGGGLGFVLARVLGVRLSEERGWDMCDGVWDIYSLCKVGTWEGGGGAKMGLGKGIGRREV